MAQDKVKTLYDTFVKEGYSMESEAEFRKNLADPAKRKAAYEALKKDGYEMEAYDAFEANIGYGKTQAQATPAPTATPAPKPQADVKTTPAPASPKPQSAPTPAPAPKATQPTWKPSEQAKIRMSWGLFNMLNDFREQSQARIEQAKRATMHMTPEGRNRLKAGKFQAQLAGTPTKVMGLTPNVRTAETATAGEGQGNTDTNGKPMESAQSPVPYGVRYVNGKPTTEWLLPDGSLTTDLPEADKAEYGARTVRLRNQFVDRMKQNGLDPSKQEDVQRQAQIDAETEEAKFIERTSEDANNVVAELWQEAEEKHKADKNANADREWSRYAAMGGGREMRVVTASANRHADQVSHMTRFDLEKMMETAWGRVGARMTAQCYNRLRSQYPQATEAELQKSAEEWARGLSDQAVYQYAVKQNTPKSTLEYFGRTVADANILNSIGKGLARSQAGTSGDLAAYEQAMGEYGKNHRVAQIGGTVVGMAIDPVTYISGGMGSLFGKGAMWAGGRFLASRAAGMSAEAGTRLFASSLSGRLLTGAAAGAGNFMTFETLKEAENQFLHGGHINEQGENEGYSAQALLKSAGKGLILGGVTGTMTPLLGNVTDKAVKATESTAGKVGLRATELGVSTIAEGTVFATPEWIENSMREEGDPNKRTNMDIWSDNLAMMLGFKVSHGIKSAPRVIASLRPISNPMSRAERNHNRMNFEERVRKSMDMSPSDLSFTSDEREELRRAGYGELADLFSRDREQTARAEATEAGLETWAERVEAEEIRNSRPEFDGYSDMERLMQDGRVSQAARAKAYYVLTGRMLPMGTVTGWTKDIAEDGRVTINAITQDGEVVTSRTFANEKAAEQETDNINRQAELNSVEVGERYREALADEMALVEAIKTACPDQDVETVKKIYGQAKAGNKDITDGQREMVEDIDFIFERNKGVADRYRPEAIRAELREEYGMDVEDALRKTPGKRTEKEKDIVKDYLNRLFPEDEAREEAEPTPEQQEAQGLYEEGKLLYGRFEEAMNGSAEEGAAEAAMQVTAEVDAIVLRMQEANQLFEDAFGAESEYYRFHLNENPWGLVNDPELTAEQQDAVLYYINAKAALDGVMDASHEAADRKRAEVEQSVAKRTHKDTGAITPATLKVNDRQVYIVKGDVVMFPDGSGVDAHNSSESVVVMDAESGEYEFASPEQIFKVGENIDPEDEMRTALEAIEQERDAIFGDKAIPTEEQGETPASIDGNNDPQNIPTEVNNDAENIPATADTEKYDQGYENGITSAQEYSDERLNSEIEKLRGYADTLTDFGRGMLEALEYIQQDRALAAQSVPENAESVPGMPENADEGGEIVPETVPTDQTALSRIPLHDETGEPMFEAVDKDLAWDGLVEAVGSDKDAADIALAQIEQANADLEALKKKPPTMKAPKLKGSPMAMAKAKQDAQSKYAQELADYNQRVADTQEKVRSWTSILGVHNTRTSELRRQQEEERRQRDAEAHDEAVAQFEEEMRLKAEREAEQAAIGTHAVNPKIKEKWDSANKIEGQADAITLPDGSTIRGRYVLTEAGAASASHDVNNAYEPTEGFPIDSNGQSVNDRDYLRDKDAQRIVEQIAGSYDSRAMQTPVIVSRDGVVLSGNNRTMSGDLAAKQGTDKAYTDYLREFGTKYGFTPEQVDGMEHPRLVFVPDEALPYDATTFSRFNAQEMKSQSKPEAAVKLGKIVPDNVFNDIVTDIAKYDRLPDYYKNEEETAHALGALMQAGVINDKQMPEMRTGTALSAAGKELIENTLIGKVFQSSPDAVRQIIAMPSVRETIVMGLGEIASNRTLGKRGYDLSAELSAAVDLVTRAKNASPDVYKEGMPVSPFGRMQGLFDDQYGDSRVTDATTLLLADILNSGKPSELRKVLAMYNKDAGEAAAGAVDLFNESGKPYTKEELLTTINERFRNATPKEQQALVESAIAENKRRAEEKAAERQRGGDTAGEQTPNADERGGESGEPTADEPLELEPLGKDRNDPNEDTPEEVALRARIGIGDEWEEDGADPDKPIYKRKLYIDGKHEIIQTDAPDEKGSYMGSLLTYDGRDFGDLREIADYIDGKTTPATSDVNLNPTEAQKEAGNYKKGHVTIEGMRISIENPKDSIRSGKDADGKAWETRMTMDYGYIRGTQGKDKDHIDIFLSDVATDKAWLEEWDMDKKIYVIDQYNKDGSFDEHKVVFGVVDENQARMCYLENYSSDWAEGRRIEVTEVSMEDFKKWAFDGRRKIKPFAEYKAIKAITEDADQTRTNVNADGMIVDENGKPLTLYHGTPNKEVTSVSQLEPGHKRMGEEEPARFNGDGVSFTPDMTVAQDYAELPGHGKGRIFPANIRLKNPYFTLGVAHFTPEEAAAFTADLKAKGHDGIINYSSKAMREAGALPNEVIAFDKSAIVPIKEEREDGWDYTITPTTYTNKKGKTSDVWLVKFDRDLSKEEKAALDSFSREPLTEGRKTSRGWYDRKEGGYMMRSEEAAKKLAELIGNEEAVADAQPLTADELRDAVETPADGTLDYKAVNNEGDFMKAIHHDWGETPKVHPASHGTMLQFAERSIINGRNRTTRQLGNAQQKYAEVDLYPSEEKMLKTAGFSRKQTALILIDDEGKCVYDFVWHPNQNKGSRNWVGVTKTLFSPEKPKKAPVNRVSLEEVMTDLSDKGETKLSDHAEPVKKEPEAQHEISDDEMASLANELRDLLGIGEDEGDGSIKFRDPGELTPQERQKIQSAGIRLAMGMIERGVTKFPDLATKMVAMLGDKIRPWLKSFYEGARWTPGYDKYEFSPTEEVAKFDVENFDKPTYDAIKDAEMRVEERKAQTAAEQADKELKETRNKQRKENDKQREADTEALAEKADAVASKAESLAETSKDATELNQASEKIDQTIDEINDQLAILGYYEADLDSPEHEVYGLRRSAEKKAVKDAVKLAKQLVDDLGIEIDKVGGQTTEQMQKSRGKNDTAVRANIAQVGGDITINLPYPDGRNLHINIGLSPTHERGVEPNRGGGAWEGDNYEVDRIMFRFGDGHNHFLSTDVTYGKMLSEIQSASRWGQPKKQEAPKSEPTPTDEESHNGYKRGDEVLWDRYGNGKWEKVKIEDFDTDGSPIFESVKGIMSEKGDWNRVKPTDGVFGEAKRVATKSQADRKKSEPPAAPDTETATEKAVEVLTGGKKKPANKKKEVKPEQPVGDLFGWLFDEEPISDEKKTDVQSRPGTPERAGGHEPQPNEPLGTSQRNEVKGTDGRGMGGRDNVNPMSDGERGARVSRQPKSAERLERLPDSERKNIRNNHADRGTDYAPKAEDARIKANIQAIELAKQLLESGETATPEQMALLRKFSGWGGLGRAFNENNTTSRQLRNLLGEEGYEQANMSRNSAYYTPAEVIDTMWDIAKAMGFQGGNVLEGSAGIGNILGLMPSELSDRSNIHAVEIDGTTGGILSLLYPDAKVDIQGFEQTKIRNNSVDLAITNVPFVADLHVMDKTGDKDLSTKFRDIHDFCISKNIRKLREGGIGIFITSNGTMDNSARLRAWISNEGNADVVGAFRMHNKTFGGTGATSDIIVVRKRVNGKPSPNAINVTDVTGVRTVQYDTGDTKKVAGQEIPIIKTLPMEYNKYFAEHPEYMAGEMRFGFEEGDTYRPQSKALYPVKGKNQSEMLKSWVDQFREMKPEDEALPVEYSATRLNEQLGEGVKEGSMILNSQGELCVARMGEAVPIKVNKNKVKGHTKAECFNAYTAIKKALKNVLDYQASNDDNKGLEPLLKELNRAFDSFTRTYGNLHKNTSISFLRNDVDFSSILALETYSEKGDKSGKKVVKVGKTDIFSRRVIETEKEPQPKDIKDGILASLYKNGGVDVDYIADALGKSAEEVRKDIVESGLGFENPATGNMEVSYQYLSGNVREKLHIAEENNEDGRYDKNVSALQRALPMTIPAHLIEFSLGSSWIDHRLYEDFVEEKTGVKIGLTNAGGTWFMKRPWSTFNEKNRAMGVVSKICGKTIMGDELLEAALTNKTITVSKTERHYDGSTETINDPEATRLCATKIDELRAEFKDWARAKMQTDSELSETIERTYNEQFNNYVPLTIPEEFVPKHFGGQVSELHGRPFALRPHQGRAVVKATTQPVLLAHEVGTGKTYTLITTAMEMRRLGTARKPMIVVQNATVGQFVESAKEIYPNAKVLTIEEADRTAEGRRNFYAKIKYNDWDMIVVPQSVFERIPDSEEREMAYVKGIIEEKLKVLEAMREADDDGRSMIVRQAEKELELQEQRLAELTEALEIKRNNRDAKREAKIKQNAEVRALEMLDREVDDVENFDDMGIDAILVDEAHEYKHLGFATAMQRGVKGVDPSYSKKSQGVFLKAQAVLEHNNGRNVVFATGTPISNTAAEIWTFMRYLMPADTMKAYGIYYFDDFVRNFGNISQMVEFTTSGKFKENNRFAGYINLPELVRIWSSVADTVLTRDAGGVSDKIPDIEGGKAQDVYLPQTRALRSIMLYVNSQLDKYDKMTGKEKKENSHIPLVMYGIAKAGAVDARLVLSDAPDEPNSKTNATVRSTLEALEKSKDYKGTVAIFADNYQNKSSGFNLYEDIRDKLIAHGVPSDQIVIIKSGMTIKRKLDIFEKVNAGEIRVVMGSTFTLGTGVNIQERLYRAIHIDAPNRPMDYTQRNGRILRQGNLHKDMGIPVSVVRFGVEDSLDVTAYQRLKTKGAIADSIMNGSKMMQNSMENRVLEEEEDTFGDMTAQLSGSEYAILKNQAEREVRSLTAKQKNHEADQIYIHNKLPEIIKYIRGAEWRIENETSNLETIGKHWPDGKIKNIKIGKLAFKSIADMEDFIKEQNAKLTKASEEMKQGGEDNYTSMLTLDIDGMEFIVTSIIRPKVTGVGQLSLELERSVSYTCPALNIKDCSPSGQRLKAVLEDIEQNIVTGERSRSLLHNGEAQLARYSEERKVLESRKGAEFPFTKELNEAKVRLGEYEAAMKKEMEAKEKKYAELDKSVEAATEVTLSDEDGEDNTPTNGDGNKYRLIEERGLLDFLDGQPLKKGYRYSQWANMGVLPPMTAKENGDWRAPMVFSQWEQSEEGMRKANGKADLVQGNGRTTGDVAYNPYFHIRTSPLNDQFTAAYDRPELLVVEGYYPESEETSGYRADGAKDAVGLMDWHSGSVNGQLSEDTKVQTMLSRYFKPGRIVPWSEVADLIMERVGDQKITFPINAVPPMLRAELAKRGAKFGDISGSVAEADIPMLNDLRDRVNAGEWDAGLEKAREYLSAYESSTEAKESRVMQLASKLNTPVRIISDEAEIKALPTKRERRAKGWWSSKSGEVVVVLPNNVNVADVENTVVHEVVGHKGLRAFIGEERFNEFLGEVYDHASNPIRAKIDKETDRMVSEEADRLREQKRKAHERAGEDYNSTYYSDMAEARVEAEKKREEYRREATEEYMADLGGRIGDAGFEKMSRDELTLWGKIKAKVQGFLDKFLRGLKIAKSIRLNDKDLSYILFKSWKNAKERGVFADAEDAVRRRKSGYDADAQTRFRDPGLGLEETITKMKTEAMNANTANLQAKRDAMRAIGGNLNHLRSAMARQREYDITTVKSVSDLARILMEHGLLDDLSKYETKRILSAINNVVGKQDVSQYVQKVMDIMVDNQLRMSANTLGRLMSIRGNRVDARGIEVQGELDPEGQRIAQVVRKSTTLPKDDIDTRMSEAMNRMSSSDQAIADEATIEYAGLTIARQYVEDITESKAEEKALRESIKQAKEDKDAGQMTEAAYRQLVEATEDAIRQNKIERAESFYSLAEQLGGVLNESIERAKQWREAEKQRVEEIHHNANSDMTGRPTDEHHKDSRTQKIANNSAVRFLLAPLATFDQILRMFGGKSVRGEGYLWNRYMRGWVEASEKEFTNYQEALKTLDAKVSEVFGRKMTWGDLFSIDRKLPKASVKFWDGGEMKEHELTQGNLLYIYMADKMSDGRMKLRRMGITEDDVNNIRDFIDPRFITLADWMQEEFLVDKRNEYNEVHKRMFGSSMAAIETYFPLKILANARLENVDVADDTTDTALPATSTGSIIKRRRNNLALDVTGANAFSVILDHLQQMERWAAFAEFNRDLNTLLSYKRFRNQVMNMTSAYGAGKTLWNNFRNVCSMAAGAYRPPIAALDKAAVNIAKGVTAAKVSFRVFTALKQFLSMPAYVSDSNPIHLAANIANPVGAWNWSIKNLPLFEKRWKSRMAGDPRLLKSDMDWKMWRSRIVELASRVGMSPNAFVDALTVAIGTHAMYQTKKAKYLRWGMEEGAAEKRAKQDATILFNQTQQSSEGAFLSTMQVDRSWLSVLFTVFRNSSMSYTRQLYDAMRNLAHRMKPGFKDMSNEYMAKQMRRDGIDPDTADREAKREYRRGILRDLVRVGIFGATLQLAWNLGAYLPYILLGDDKEEKDKMWDDVWNHTMFGSIEGLTGGDVMSAAGNMWVSGDGNPAYLTKDMPLASDVLNILKKWDKDKVGAMNDVINLLVQSGLGVNPQSLTDATLAVMDYCGDDAQSARECALLITRILNCPQSQIDKIYFDELNATGEEASRMTPQEIAERFARYKVRRGAPLTGWAYGNETRETLMNKYRDRSNKLAKERISRETDRQAGVNSSDAIAEYESTKARVAEVNKVRKQDEERYFEQLDTLENSPEFERYLIVGDYKREVDELTKQWLRAKTTEERDSIARGIVNLKKEMLKELHESQ